MDNDKRLLTSLWEISGVKLAQPCAFLNWVNFFLEPELLPGDEHSPLRMSFSILAKLSPKVDLEGQHSPRGLPLYLDDLLPEDSAKG